MKLRSNLSNKPFRTKQMPKKKCITKRRSRNIKRTK